MENNDIPVGHIVYNRKNWKKAYFTMRGYAVIFAIIALINAIALSFFINRPKVIKPSIAYEIMPGK